MGHLRTGGDQNVGIWQWGVRVLASRNWVAWFQAVCSVQRESRALRALLCVHVHVCVFICMQVCVYMWNACVSVYMVGTGGLSRNVPVEEGRFHLQGVDGETF